MRHKLKRLEQILLESLNETSIKQSSLLGRLFRLLQTEQVFLIGFAPMIEHGVENRIHYLSILRSIELLLSLGRQMKHGSGAELFNEVKIVGPQMVEQFDIPFEGRSKFEMDVREGCVCR